MPRRTDGQITSAGFAAREAKAKADIEKWLRDQGAVESFAYDEETGVPQRRFTIDLTK